MAFGDSYIETAFGHLGHHDIERTTGRHCRCYSDDALIGTSQIEQCLPEDILIFCRSIRIVSLGALTGLRVETSGGMPRSLVEFGGAVSFSLYGEDVEEFRTVDMLQIAQDSHQ